MKFYSLVNSRLVKSDRIFYFLKILRFCKIISKTKMGQKKMQMAEKSCALTLLEKGDSVLAVTRNIYQLKREAIYQLKRSAALLPPRMVLKRKSGSGAPEKT